MCDTSQIPVENQTHLGYAQRVNLGSYYTKNEYVSIVWDLIVPLLENNSVVLDTSCGYGNFLRPMDGLRVVGNDIDTTAARMAQEGKSFAKIFNFNALTDFARASYGISDEEKLIIIGNPPYNDTTSIIRNETKKQLFDIDRRVASRDLGISFLLSYKELNAKYICVLHPLSYLIKKANFNSLRRFACSYKLVDSIVIGSGVFSQTSKVMQFPILIALYRSESLGMDYHYIQKHLFHTIEGKSFSMDRFDYIGNFIGKYPSKKHLPSAEDLYFYTMRDLNALKRSQTFMKTYGSNSIVVDKSKLDFYIYVDVVKDFGQVFPYYFGNFDVIINEELFLRYREAFLSYGLSKRPFLRKYFPDSRSISDHKNQIIDYFKLLLGEHYVKDNDS